MTARAFAAQVARERLRSAVPDVDTYCDAEINDSMYFTLFPNFHPWGALTGLTTDLDLLERKLMSALWNASTLRILKVMKGLPLPNT